MASGAQGTALGQSSMASGTQSTALGQASTASGNYSTAVGQYSSAPGTNSTALGQVSTAIGDNSTALGEGTDAGFTNSTAIGYNATTTRDNQMVLGTASNTYTAPGIESAASRTAQSGPTQLVTSDAGGNLATADPNSVVAGTPAFQSLQHQVNRTSEGVAMAMAVGAGGTILPCCMNRAVSMEYGNFEGYSAIGLSGVQRLGNNWFANGGVAVGGNYGSVGGRVGVTYAW